MSLSIAATPYEELEEVLMSLAFVTDGDEPIDELSHALQCAANAQAAKASRDLIAASLFHDVARSPLVKRQFPGVGHEIAAEAWLRPRLGDHVAWLAGAHVAAKMHLLATEPGYLALLSSQSVASATHQGAAIRAELLGHPWWPDALRLRRFDDAAKKRNVPLPDPKELLAIVRPLLVR